ARLRKELFDGGKAKVDASKDPLIAFAKSFDPEARAARKRIEDEVEGPVKKNGEMLGKAYFAVFGTGTYPDATFTLRINYGKIAGWKEGDKEIPALTNFAGAFERHTGREPFALPKSWLDAKPKLT